MICSRILCPLIALMVGGVVEALALEMPRAQQNSASEYWSLKHVAQVRQRGAVSEISAAEKRKRALLLGILSGDPQTAIKQLGIAADEGDALAHYYLGEFHRDGKGVPRDLDKAVTYFQHALRFGYLAAHDALGRIYNEKGSPLKDSDKALSHFKASPNVNSLAETIGRIYLARNSTPDDLRQAADWLERADYGRDTSLMMRIARHYRTGDIIDPDGNSKSLAIYLLATSLENELAETQVRYLDHRLKRSGAIDGANIALIHARQFKYPIDSIAYLERVYLYFRSRKY